jgi:hypothetical protein
LAMDRPGCERILSKTSRQRLSSSSLIMTVPIFVLVSIIALAYPASAVIYALIVILLFAEFILKEIPRLI